MRVRRGRSVPDSLSLHLGAADYGVLAGVIEEDPGLVAAVVVGGPELQGRWAVPDGYLVSPVESRPRQIRTKGLCSYSSPIVVGSL